jgi:hypothetical protein
MLASRPRRVGGGGVADVGEHVLEQGEGLLGAVGGVVGADQEAEDAGPIGRGGAGAIDEQAGSLELDDRLADGAAAGGSLAGLDAVRGLAPRVVGVLPVVGEGGGVRAELAVVHALEGERDAAVPGGALVGGEAPQELAAQLVVGEAQAVLVDLEHGVGGAGGEVLLELAPGRGGELGEHAEVELPPEHGGGGEQRAGAGGRAVEAAGEHGLDAAGGDLGGEAVLADAVEGAGLLGEGAQDLDDEEGVALGLALEEGDEGGALAGVAEHGAAEQGDLVGGEAAQAEA